MRKGWGWVLEKGKRLGRRSEVSRRRSEVSRRRSEVSRRKSEVSRRRAEVSRRRSEVSRRRSEVSRRRSEVSRRRSKSRGGGLKSRGGDLKSRGGGDYFRVYAIHEIAKSLGRQKCKALLFFHAFTGSDTTGFFKGVGKKKAWEAWKVMPEMTPIFARLGTQGPKSSISARDFRSLQRFVCYVQETLPLFEGQ